MIIKFNLEKFQVCMEDKQIKELYSHAMNDEKTTLKLDKIISQNEKVSFFGRLYMCIY